MIEVFPARSGAPTLTVDGVAVHSPYDPVREAERFVSDSLHGERPSTVIVLGEGLGHITDAVRKILPGTRTIRVVYAPEIFRASTEVPGLAWHPGAAQGLAGFLRAHLEEIDVEGLRVLEWPPSARLFPSVSLSANEAVRQVAQEMNGSLVTTLANGRLWIRNTFANFLDLPTPVVGAPCGRGRPVLIAAPGPSLEEAVPFIRDARESFELWALPSSRILLEDAGLSPDLVVMTDSGFYSMHHLHFSPLSCPIAMPLSAARGSWGLHRTAGLTGPFLLEQPVFFEQALLQAAGTRAPVVPPHGTVAATAIDLALSATNAAVIVAGLDMCSRDILTHGRPNAFDALLHLQAARTSPHTSLSFHRAWAQHLLRTEAGTGSRVSPSLKTYAGWFDEGGQKAGERLYRLLPSEVPLRSMHPLDRRAFFDLLASGKKARPAHDLHPCDDFPQPDQRRLIAAEVIEAWRNEIDAANASHGSFGVERLEGFPTVLALAGTVEPRLLIDARKKGRSGDTAGARKAVERMLEVCSAFLQRIGEKTRATA